MKFTTHSDSGSVLTVVLVTVILIGVTLSSYLGLVSNQNLSIQRSQNWNASIPIAEAGIEEAMAHLNKNGTNRVRDGWQLDDTATNVFKERTIGDNSYRVLITVEMEPPMITSSGIVVIPNDDSTMRRTIRAGTTNDALFSKGMVAKGEIDLSGNNVNTDSFDSSDPAYSTGGRYDPAKSKDGGDVATNSSLVDSLDVWNADINGRASTGPGGTVRIGPNGSVGPKWWTEAGNRGIYDPTWVNDDMNVHFPDVSAPFNGGGFSPNVNQNVNGTNYSYVINSGNYQMSSISMSGQNKMLVQGDAVLYVTGNVSLSGQAFIQLAPGASLQLYVAGSSTSIGGQGIMNPTGTALHFGYWGLNSNTSVSMSGNAAFTGTIYAPHAALTLGGGGGDDYDFVGASVSNSVRLNGHYHFHYDEALKTWGPKRGYTVVSWNEGTWEEI